MISYIAYVALEYICKHVEAFFITKSFLLYTNIAKHTSNKTI